MTFMVIVYLAGNDAPLALVGASFETPALIGGTILFAALVGWLYSRTRRTARLS